MSLRAFEMAIDAYLEKDIPEAVTTMQRVIATAALYGVVLKTPVDKGRARGGWLTTLNSVTWAAPDTIYGEAGSGAGAAASAAINAGLGVINGIKPFGLVTIQNNVEYIEDLEDGGSKQAPGGMLAVTVAELEAHLA